MTLKKSIKQLNTLQSKCANLLALVSETTADAGLAAGRSETISQIHQKLVSNLENFEVSPFLVTAGMSETNPEIVNTYHNRVATSLKDTYSASLAAEDPGHNKATDAEKYIARARALYSRIYTQLELLSANNDVLKTERIARP